MSQRQGSLYLLTGLILGFGLALVYAWLIAPPLSGNVTPASLEAAQEDRYRLMIATSYRATGDLVRARARLDLLEDPDPYQSLIDQIDRQTYLVSGFELESLRLLAEAIEAPQYTSSPSP